MAVDTAALATTLPLRRRALASMLALGAAAAAPAALVDLPGSAGWPLLGLSLGLGLLAVQLVAGRLDGVARRPVRLLWLLVPAAPAVVWSVVEGGGGAGSGTPVLLMALQVGVAVATGAGLVLGRRPACVLGVATVSLTNLVVVLVAPAILETPQGVGALVTNLLVGLAVVAFVHLQTTTADLLQDSAATSSAQLSARRTLQAMAAHDLRTPLSVARAALDTLDDHAETLDPQHLRDVVRVATDAVMRASRLTQDLLDETRVVDGEQDRRTVQIGELVRSAVTASRVPANDVSVLGADFTVEVRRDRVERILVNLLDNAAKHGAPPILVETELHAASYTLRVTDAGPGLAQHLVGQPVLSTSRHGTDVAVQGLGLHIVRAFAAELDGDVHAEIPSGGGASLVVTLPR